MCGQYYRCSGEFLVPEELHSDPYKKIKKKTGLESGLYYFKIKLFLFSNRCALFALACRTVLEMLPFVLKNYLATAVAFYFSVSHLKLPAENSSKKTNKNSNSNNIFYCTAQ